MLSNWLLLSEMKEYKNLDDIRECEDSITLFDCGSNLATPKNWSYKQKSRILPSKNGCLYTFLKKIDCFIF